MSNINVKIDYSSVENSFIDALELAENPQDFLIFYLKNLIICDKCHQSFTIKKGKDFINFRCGCGCRIIYPKNEKGVMKTTFVSKEEYNRERGLNGRINTTGSDD